MKACTSLGVCSRPSRLCRRNSTGFTTVFVAKAASCLPSLACPGLDSQPKMDKPRGRPKGKFTQHRRLDKLRELLERHPRGLSLYDLAGALSVTVRSMRRYLKEIEREADLESVPTRGGAALLWRLRPNELPRKVELRRTQTYALLAARRLFEPMRGSALFDEIDHAVMKLLALA